MSEKLGYEKIEQTRNYYFEGSFVLGIVFDTKRVSMRLDLVLTKEHPLYSHPKPDEQHCYRTGDLVFTRIKDMCLKFRPISASADASGGVDFGNIDDFYLQDETYHLMGDWGALEIRADELVVEVEP